MRKLGYTRFAACGLMLIALASCSDATAKKRTPAPPKTHDLYGDPIVTSAQFASVKVGEPATDAFAALGGKAVSGVQDRIYQYPIAGTGDPDSSNPTALWFQICVDGDPPRVTSI